MWLPELFGSMQSKVEDSVRYHLNYPSYLDLPLGRDPFGFCSPRSFKNIGRSKAVDAVL